MNRYCGRCGTILDEGERVKLEIQNREHAKQFPELAAADPKLLEHMQKAMELVEFFEKHPELFSKMKDMAEAKS